MTGTLMLLDVGSTNSRGYLVRDGEIVESRDRDVGVRDSARDGSNRAVRSAVSQLIRELAPGDGDFTAAAAGMATSPQGLVDLPHALAPASAQDLARGALTFRDADLAPVPISSCPVSERRDQKPAWADDVMRGEEDAGARAARIRGDEERRPPVECRVTLEAGSARRPGADRSEPNVSRWRGRARGAGGDAADGFVTTRAADDVRAGMGQRWRGRLRRAGTSSGAVRCRLLDQRGGTTPRSASRGWPGRASAMTFERCFASAS